MRIQDIEIPDILTEAIEDNRLVVFAGAGVSMQPPDPLPDFTQLIEGLAKSVSPDGTVAVRYESERYESYLGRIGDAQTMKLKCAEVMSAGGPSELHANIVKMFEGGVPRIVTTNYDLRFEQAAAQLGMDLRTFSSPALPLGNDFKGIVHLHGDIMHPEEMILVDSDFGSAYVSDGWVARFLVKMFARYTVLLVGYSLRDMPMQYLARSISASLEDRVFVLENESRFFTRWRSRGITAIPFDRYEQLPDLFHDWRLRVLRTPEERAHAVANISASSGALSDYDVETLRRAFDAHDRNEQCEYARAYAQAAQGFESLARLVELGYDSFLYRMPQQPRDEVFASWAAHEFATTNYRELVLLAEEAHRPLGGHFQVLVMQKLAEADVDETCLAFWSAFLDARSMGAAGLSADVLARVIEKCTHQELALAYIRKAFSVHAALQRDESGAVPADPVARFDIAVSRGSGELQQAIARRADELGVPLFMVFVDSLNQIEGLRTNQGLRVAIQAETNVPEITDGTESLLVDLCRVLGERLVHNPATRSATLQACRSCRSEALKSIGRELESNL